MTSAQSAQLKRDQRQPISRAHQRRAAIISSYQA
jgi:hypothetical protein